ncbi:translation initiation factor IF-2 [Mycoplasma sp. CAG:956]|nr:translation initiation factor IF-2 [Mycoplasma sp. CAG:956]
MMTVKEYANDTNHTVAEILKKCEELGIKVKSGDSELSDDDIIILDNAINLISTADDTSLEEEDVIDEAVEDIMETANIKKSYQSGDKKQKLKKKSEIASSKAEFLNKRKEMYKNKSKLKKNAKEDNIILYHENMTVGALAEAIGCSAANLITKLMTNGIMSNLTMPISFEDAEVVSLEYNKVLKRDTTQDITNFEEYEIVDSKEDLVKRPPVVTIMGHVDHGKTTLLDTIRHSKVVSTESGGITQAIGAYQIVHNGEPITFIDTPGHAAFTAMRARGTSVTDIVIIIVAADDGVMPQTKEAIDHAKAAKVPIIVAVNKMDKPDANPNKVMEEMAALNITPEEWGGEYPFVKISAQTGQNIDELLETILATAEMLDLKANPNRYAVGSVIESKLDKHVGGVASILIQNGTLRIGDPIVIGTNYGKVRTMKNDLGQDVVSAGPSTPVEITGLQGNPEAGDKFMSFESETQAKEVAEKRKLIARDQKFKKENISLDSLFQAIDEGTKEINIILKTDVKGSEEALKNSLQKIEVKGVKINIIRSDIGTITESDVVLANASNAIIIGFNVAPSPQTKEMAKEYSVDIRLYNIIYKAIEDMEAAMQGMLDPEFEEKIFGRAEVRKIFTFSKVGKIAGSYVTDGLIKSNSKIRVIRDGIVIHDGNIAGLQRGKDSVKEVKKGFECGITLESYSDLKEGDILESYDMVEVKR